VIFLLCCAQFLFWYGAHVVDDPALVQYATWDGINHGNPARRIEAARELAEIPGKLLVFVHYGPRHFFQDEWVYNGADIDGQRVVWARDLGPEENDKLRRYFPDRKALVLEPDERPVGLRVYGETEP
jgi:hypothetical protein